MAQELRCFACEGELGWAGAQVSCRGCGKVYTMAGKPGSKIGVLVVGVFIGIILGAIGGIELSRFISSFDAGMETTKPIAPVSDPGQ